MKGLCKRKDKKKGSNILKGGGGKNGPAQSFPTPYLEEPVSLTGFKVEDLFDISQSKVFRYSEKVQ